MGESDCIFIVLVYSVSLHECTLYSFQLQTRLDWGCYFDSVFKYVVACQMFVLVYLHIPMLLLNNVCNRNFFVNNRMNLKCVQPDFTLLQFIEGTRTTCC